MSKPKNMIVETSMRLLASHPGAAAIDILDQAMKGSRNSAPNFESYDPVSGTRPHPAYDDETDPGSPFGELLRRAFAPSLDPRELMLLRMKDESRDNPALRERISKATNEWQKVIDKFSQHYELWTN